MRGPSLVRRPRAEQSANVIRTVAWLLAGSLALIPACSGDDNAPAGTGGSGNTGGSTATGGAANTGGSSATGGSTATGGSRMDASVGGGTGTGGGVGTGGGAGAPDARVADGTGAGGSREAGDGAAPADVEAGEPFVCPAGGGPVASDSGPDDHCIDEDGGQIIQVADVCPMGPGDAEVADDAAMEELPGPRPGNVSDDDDCKYHVTFTNTCVARNLNVTFTVTATVRGSNAPLTGAATSAEVFLNDTHPAPNSGQRTTENNGVYTIGPIRFDASGLWTVRFHFYEMCDDTVENSKHGHAAFLINVP